MRPFRLKVPNIQRLADTMGLLALVLGGIAWFNPATGQEHWFNPEDSIHPLQSDSLLIRGEVRMAALKGREIYRAYLKKALPMTEKLLTIKERIDKSNRSISLQQLSAWSHALVIDHEDLRDSFQHGEEEFQSYQLIQKAVIAMSDTVSYWRTSNATRPLYRGTRLNRAEDDEYLKTKMQKALQAIEDLREMKDIRQKLDENLHD